MNCPYKHRVIIGGKQRIGCVCGHDDLPHTWQTAPTFIHIFVLPYISDTPNHRKHMEQAILTGDYTQP